MNGTFIPKATLGRLPRYLEYLKGVSSSRRTISATAIAKGLSLGEVQVRKDLAAVSSVGKPKVGYECEKLIGDIERRLGYENLTSAVLVGVGKLGQALLDYDGFEAFGVKIVAGFDCDEKIVLSASGAKTVLPVEDLQAFCKEREVKLGIITVGRGAAQEVCDKLIESGITAIWNFASCTLKIPSGVLLKQENLALSLAYLNNQLSK